MVLTRGEEGIRTNRNLINKRGVGLQPHPSNDLSLVWDYTQHTAHMQIGFNGNPFYTLMCYGTLEQNPISEPDSRHMQGFV